VHSMLRGQIPCFLGSHLMAVHQLVSKPLYLASSHQSGDVLYLKIEE